jgi:glutathione S-transferase
MRYQFEVANSLAATVAEAGRGVRIRGAQRQPEELLELYDMENCPFCRVVRQTLTELDLDAMIYPCPKGGVRYRPLVKQLGGREMFPYLYDPNTDTGLYESADIIAYLYETYSNLPAPGYWKIKAMMTAPSMAASVLRRTKGLRSEHVQDPANPLELYSFETSPYSRLVRERLCELEIPYIVRNCGRNQPVEWLMLPALRERLAPDYRPVQRNRKALMKRTGRVQVPYLVDPNTSAELFESASIIEYLDRTYGRA